MSNTDKNTYDAFIIGAGIGGLVCGCYLARAGMKVLIAEQHFKPGGYCTSFRRKNYFFDAAPHCFGSYRKEGLTRKILEDLGVDKKLTVIRPDPTDTIIAPDCKISYWADLSKTVEEFQATFPEEAVKIKEFFSFVLNSDSHAFSRMRNLTLKNLLDSYFKDDKLKSVLAAPLLAFNGLPPSLMSAFVGTKIFSEFLFDGGYYPVNGMQALSDALAERFREFGGELRLSCLVKKIKTKNNIVNGVVIANDDFIPSKYVISDCDARQTFLKLLGRDKVEDDFYQKLKTMVPSMPNFILYLGIDENFAMELKPGTATCFVPHYDLDRAYRAAQKGNINEYGGFTVRLSHDKSTVGAMIPAPFRNKKYWMNNKQKYIDAFIERLENTLIPHLSEHLRHVEAATPYTLFRYTLNYKGASYGWACIPSQFAQPDCKKPSFVGNLYLTSHWTTLGIGISGVMYFGRDTASVLLKKEKLSI